MASDSSSGSRQGYHTFLYGHTKYNRVGWRKRTNEQTGTLVSSKRKKGSFVTLCIFRAFVDYHGRVFCAKLPQKPLKMPTHLWLSSLTASFCWPSFPWTAVRGKDGQADWSLLLSVVDCISPSSFVNWPSVFFGTFLSSSTSSLAGDLIVRPFVWVSRQSS